MARKPRPKLTTKERVDRSFRRLMSDIDKVERQEAKLLEVDRSKFKPAKPRSK